MNIAKLNKLYAKIPSSIKFAYYVIAVALLLVSVYTDLIYSDPMPPDMRNRIVGARMMEDGLSPYFYIWQKGGPVRYFDINTPPNTNVSRATASPFFHWLIIPIADLPQSQLNVLWMFIEYAALISCGLLALAMLPGGQRRVLLPFITALLIVFCYTQGWRIHVYGGQNYIFIPLLMLGSVYFMRKARSWFNTFVFGILSTCLILVYPAAVVVFIPFILYIRQYLRHVTVTLGMLIIYMVVVLANPVQRANWSDYFRALPIHATNHVGITKTPEIVYDPVSVKLLEGINFKDTPNKQRTARLTFLSQCSNFFYYFNVLTHKRISIKAMLCLGVVVCIALMLPLLYFKIKGIPVSYLAVYITGFAMFNCFNFFGPVIRCDYHFVTFLLPLLLLVVWLKKVYVVPLILICIGFYLNITFLRFMLAQHTVGEFFILLSLLYFVYRPLLFKGITENKWRVNDCLYVL